MKHIYCLAITVSIYNKKRVGVYIVELKPEYYLTCVLTNTPPKICGLSNRLWKQRVDHIHKSFDIDHFNYTFLIKELYPRFRKYMKKGSLVVLDRSATGGWVENEINTWKKIPCWNGRYETFNPCEYE